MKAIETGRFVIPRDSTVARRFLQDNLLPIHPRGARMRAILLGARVRGTEIDVEDLPFVPKTGEWILVRDYDGEPRLVFRFESGVLRSVMKIRRRGDPSMLEREKGVLAAIRPPNAPRVEDYSLDKTHETLTLTPVPGRALDISMQRSLRPRGSHRRHLLAAARWLGNFHRIKDAVHGDFWPRNVLFTGDEVTGVVDWEHGGLGGDRWRDVFLLPHEFVTRAPSGLIRPSPRASAYINAFLREYAKASGIELSIVRRKFEEQKESGWPSASSG